MATVGLRDLFYAPITMQDGIETYGAVKRLAKAIKADMSVETTDDGLYADDGMDISIKEFVKGTLTLGVNDLDPKIIAELLGQQINDDGVTFAGEFDEPPYFAIAFRAQKASGGRFRYLWLYKVKFAVPSENYETKSGSINFVTPEIVGDFFKREKDGNWKADYTGLTTDAVAEMWFDDVVEPSTNPRTEPESVKVEIAKEPVEDDSEEVFEDEDNDE